MKRITLLGIALLIIACTTTESSNSPTGVDLTQLFEDYKDFTYFIYPEYATYDGVHDYNDRLNDQSTETGELYMDSINVFRQSLLSIEVNGLTADERLNYDLFLFVLDQIIDEYSYEISHYVNFNQQNGYHITFPQITEVQPLNTEEDVENYFLRLLSFPEQVDHIIANLQLGASKGITLPCNVSQQVLDQLSGFSEMALESSPLYQAKDKSEALAAQEAKLRSIIENEVAPAYGVLLGYFRDEYHPFCRTDVGVSHLDGGAEFYEFLVRKFTNSKLLPNEVFDLGMQEIERIKEEMIATKDELGYASMELIDFFNHLRTSPEFYFTDKQDLLDGYRTILDNMDTKLPDLFGRLPKSPYDLKEMEAYRAVAAPTAYYYPLPADGSRPGYFYVNTYKLDARPKYTMTALALHEAVPGHHLQFAVAAELEDVPWFRNQMQVTAFVEGWGLYAEYLGYESDMYSDPLQKMGALSFEIWRACRLVVDVGLHYKGWTKEEASALLRENAPLAELDINSEIDRYISWPGQALAYKVGELRLKSLRSMASDELGDDFDIREFHDVVLANGSIPLDLLEVKVREWISTK